MTTPPPRAPVGAAFLLHLPVRVTLETVRERCLAASETALLQTDEDGETWPQYPRIWRRKRNCARSHLRLCLQSLPRMPHVYAVAGKYFDTFLGNSTSFLETSGWLRYVPNAPISLDLNARLQISELYWAGIGVGGAFGQKLSGSVRLETGFVLGEQVRIENGQFKIGLAYDQPLVAPLTRYFGGAFEVHLLYSWWK